MREKTDMTHFFISYSRLDAEFGENLIHRLRAQGFDTWVDTEMLLAGHDWRTAIDDALRTSAAVIVVMTPAAKASEYVTYEWAFALGAGVPVIPVLLDRTDLHPRLAALQYLEFTGPIHLRPWERLFDSLRAVMPKEAPKVHLTPEEIQHLVADFDSLDPNVRRIAIGSLASRAQEDTLQALVGALQHPRRDVRIEAATKLAETGIKDNAYVISILIEALHGPTREMSERAGWALMQIGSPAVQALIAAMRSPDDQVRERAAEILGWMKNAMAVSGLIELLHEEDIVNVPKYAITALGRIGNSEALCAISALIKKLTEFLDVLEYATSTDQPHLTKQCLDAFDLIVHSVHTLATIGFPAVPAIVELVEWLISSPWIVDHYIAMVPDWFQDAIRTSVQALGTIGSPEAIPVLLKAIQLSRFVRYKASISRALVQIDGPVVIDGLRRLLHDAACTPELRSTVHELLQRLGASEA
jgi:HEAT repeat protein